MLCSSIDRLIQNCICPRKFRHGMSFSKKVHQTWDVCLSPTTYSEIVPHTIYLGFLPSLGWFMLYMMRVDHARMMLHFSDARGYRKEKMMPPRFLQTPSGQHMESSSEFPAAHMTELHIKLENEGTSNLACTFAEIC